MAQSVNITELNLPQLEMLKNQLDQVRMSPEKHLWRATRPVSRAYSLTPQLQFLSSWSRFPDETPVRSQDLPRSSPRPTVHSSFATL